MKMKKLTVIFGGTIGLYLGYFGLFRGIDKTFNCSVRRNGANSLFCRIEGINVDFKFCLNPIRDRNYLMLKQGKEKGFLKELVCLPAGELVGKIKKTDMVLFFGLCGGFRGRKSDIYFPEKFKEVFFNNYVGKKEISKMKAFNQIRMNNLFLKKFKGKEIRVVISNLTLMPENIEDNCKESLILLSNTLLKYGNVVDKESYQIVKGFNGKVPLGIMLMASDVLSVKRNILKQGKGFKPNIIKFNLNVIKCLRFALKELKK